MPLKFLEFDNPEEEQKELEADLAIINEDIKEPIVEDLNQSPFIKEPKRIKKETFKPPPPNKEDIQKEMENADMEFDKEKKRIVEKPEKKVKTLKPKKPLTEKQKAHLENMRLKRAEKQKAKLEQQMNKTDIVAKAEKKMNKPVEYSEEEIKEMEEFDNWLKQMDKFNKMMEAIEKEKKRKLELEQKKEAEIEARIRKKIEMENKQRQGQVIRKNKPQPTQNLPPILQQQENEYGEYAHMFGF
jgi:hypothetical protein